MIYGRVRVFNRSPMGNFENMKILSQLNLEEDTCMLKSVMRLIEHF